MLFYITGGILFFVYKDRVYQYTVDKLIEKTQNKLEKKHINKIIIISICNTMSNALCGIDPYAGLVAAVVSSIYFPENTTVRSIVNGYKYGSIYGAVKNCLFQWIIDCYFVQHYLYGLSFSKWYYRRQIANQYVDKSVTKEYKMDGEEEGFVVFTKKI